MNLTELLQKLSFGPLAELSIGGQGSGTIPAEKVPQLVVHINDVLNKLYDRFTLQKRTVILETVDGLYAYRLAVPFAQTSSSSEINKYLKDTPANPFLDDVLQVTDILGNQSSLPTDPNYLTQPQLDSENDYVPLPLNDRNDRLSWHTLSYDTLGMDYPKTGDRYFIQYRAKHARIPLQPVSTDDIEIRVPSPLEMALLSGVAAGVFGGMSMETALAKSRKHWAIYNVECERCEANNDFHQFYEPTNIKPRLGGWI